MVDQERPYLTIGEMIAVFWNILKNQYWAYVLLDIDNKLDTSYICKNLRLT